MSQVATCPNCGSKSKIKEKNGVITYEALQDEEALKKIIQLKNAMVKFKEKSERLEKELAQIKAKS
jgi:cell fate (sporulation/competence/biofilm development) regulator YlbF (YheA/YmcA/DUF963 family)